MTYENDENEKILQDPTSNEGVEKCSGNSWYNKDYDNKSIVLFKTNLRIFQKSRFWFGTCGASVKS